MNYKKIYGKITTSKYDETIYMESHHILPKCMGGNNTKENLVKLPYRLHFLCHWLLCKMYPNDFRLKAAFCKMLETTSNTKRIVSSKQFDAVKRNVKNIHYPWLKKYLKENGPWNKGKIGVQIPWNKGKQIGANSKESNKQRSKTLKERYSNVEHHRKNKEPWNKGKIGVQIPWNKGKQEVRKECPYCHKTSNPGNYSRWHGDNCKMRV